MTIEFPHESERKVAIQNKLSAYFEFGTRLLKFWIRSKKPLSNCKFPERVIDLAFGLSIKATRQFRTVIELCERGESEDAAIISRSMFETIVALNFVLKPKFKYVHKADKKAGKPERTESLSRDFRALLYMSSDLFDPERDYERHANLKKTKGVTRMIKKRFNDSENKQIATEAKNCIGSDWTEILLNKQNYSGLSLASLSKKLDKSLHKWYVIIYSDQCKPTHAADAVNFLMRDVENNAIAVKWHGTIKHTLLAMQASISLFLMSLHAMDSQIHFGTIMSTAIEAFTKELHVLYAKPLD